MKPIASMPTETAADIKYVLTDLDDTLTLDGRLPAVSYQALEKLEERGKQVIIVTGRPSGWCDMIARFWPVAGVIGENGALAFRYERQSKKMRRLYEKSVEQREQDRNALHALTADLKTAFDEIELSADQFYREADIAVDFCEDVPPWTDEKIDNVVQFLRERGATAKVSSIHINFWLGTYDKLKMTSRFFQETFDVKLDEKRDQCIYAGDSPNDEPMFAYFPHSVGVANIAAFVDQMTSLPAYVTKRDGGSGFQEIADVLAHPR